MMSEHYHGKISELIILAKERMGDGDRNAAMLHCRRALETILHVIQENMTGEKFERPPPNTKWITSFKGYLGKDRGKWKEWKLLFEIANNTNPWLHENPHENENLDDAKAEGVFRNLYRVCRGVFGHDIESEINSRLLIEFDEKSLNRVCSEELNESAREFIDQFEEGPEKESWAEYLKNNPDADPLSQMRMLAQQLSENRKNWLNICSELYDDFDYEIKLVPIKELEEIRKSSPSVESWKEWPTPNLEKAFALSSSSHILPIVLLEICEEYVNPNADWNWDLYVDSTPEEVASQISEPFMGWMDMRLIPDGEKDEIVQLYPRTEYCEPDKIDFEEIRRNGTSSILKEAFSIRGEEKLRPIQLTNALAVLGCEVEWALGSRNAVPEEVVAGIPENCIKWMEWSVEEIEGNATVFLSMR